VFLMCNVLLIVVCLLTFVVCCLSIGFSCFIIYETTGILVGVLPLSCDYRSAYCKKKGRLIAKKHAHRKHFILLMSNISSSYNPLKIKIVVLGYFIGRNSCLQNLYIIDKDEQ